MRDSLISVIMPVYNGAAFIREAMDSILVQCYSPLEIVVVDDGSTDQTAAVIHEVGATSSVPVVYDYQRNSGPSSARNRGMELARGNVLAFLDADDLWDATKLVVQSRMLASQPDAQVIWGRVQKFATNGQQRIAKDPPCHGPHVGSGLFRRTAFEQVGVFDRSMRFSEDLDWLLRARELRIPYVLHPEITLWYRHHANNMWLGQPNEFGNSLWAVKKRLDRQRQGLL